jgi:hypothetical protein
VEIKRKLGCGRGGGFALSRAGGKNTVIERETFLQFTTPVRDSVGRIYTAQACGAEMPDGMWYGWVEFLPVDGGLPIATGRETTQPNRTDTEYWATGLSEVYLEGALQRAFDREAEEEEAEEVAGDVDDDLDPL